VVFGALVETDCSQVWHRIARRLEWLIFEQQEVPNSIRAKAHDHKLLEGHELEVHCIGLRTIGMGISGVVDHIAAAVSDIHIVVPVNRGKTREDAVQV